MFTKLKILISGAHLHIMKPQPNLRASRLNGVGGIEDTIFSVTCAIKIQKRLIHYKRTAKFAYRTINREETK